MRAVLLVALALVLMVALAGPASKAIAEPVVLKCRSQDGRDVADLTVDTENNYMRWGTNYNIVHVSSEYITAYQETLNIVGGEVFVMHRATGEAMGVLLLSARSQATGTCRFSKHFLS